MNQEQMNLLKQQALAAQKKGLTKDQSKESAGEFKYEPPAAGVCVGRMVSYIEIGNHTKANDKFNKGAQPNVITEFELLGKKHAKEIETDGNKKTIYPIMREQMVLSGSKKSWFFKMMHALDYGRGNTHMAFFLGDGFKFNVLHNEIGEGKDKKVYANIRNDSGWTISAPTREVEDESGELQVVALKVQQATAPLRMFLWDAPTKEQWDSLFIDGYREVEKDGVTTKVSKNWIQEMILKADNFHGSPIETLLAELDGGLPDPDAKEPDFPPEDEDEDLDGDEGSAGTDPASGGVENGVSDDEDPFAALGLDDEE